MIGTGSLRMSTVGRQGMRRPSAPTRRAEGGTWGAGENAWLVPSHAVVAQVRDVPNNRREPHPMHDVDEEPVYLGNRRRSADGVGVLKTCIRNTTKNGYH